MYQHYRQHLVEIERTGKRRKLPDSFDDGGVINFSSNDYFCLSHHPDLIQAAVDAAHRYGVGATGSRLLSGNVPVFEALEKKIATSKKTDDALIFNSGFQANLSALSCLLDTNVLKERPLVFFDKLNHASLYQAVFLSKAELVRYHHNDMQHLEKCLNDFKDSSRPKFIVTETIFGMDGDVLPIVEIVNLAKKNNAFLYLDEAHATGMIGHNGYGLSTTVDLNSIPHLVMGTFSKALGCSGGYVACSTDIKDYFLNKAQGFIYSTANSPVVIGAVDKAWDMIQTLQTERGYLKQLGDYLRRNLKDLGFDTGLSTTHIIPIIIGKEEAALRMRDHLQNNAIIASCIRPPTVPPGTSRLRFALNVQHTKDDVEKLLGVLKMFPHNLIIEKKI